MEFLNAAFLGVVEGLTEFLPVSSTGHLILFVDLLGFQGPPGHVFEVAIQLGAILAVLLVYWRRLFAVATGFWAGEVGSRIFVRNILLAFTPAMAIGVVAHSTIKAALFNPPVVACALMLGGVVMLIIEKIKPAPRIHAPEEMGWKTALTIGLVQCVAMVPGVSRSGATIMGALMCGLSRKAAAEFSFFLAIPTMFAATVYDLYKARAALDMAAAGQIAVGFISAFLVALLVVRWLVRFVETHGFAPFAWYRIALGALILLWM